MGCIIFFKHGFFEVFLAYASSELCKFILPECIIKQTWLGCFCCDDLCDYSGRGLRELCSAAVALIDSIVPLFIPTHSFLINFTRRHFEFNDKSWYCVLLPHIWPARFAAETRWSEDNIIWCQVDWRRLWRIIIDKKAIVQPSQSFHNASNLSR